MNDETGLTLQPCIDFNEVHEHKMYIYIQITGVFH